MWGVFLFLLSHYLEKRDLTTSNLSDHLERGKILGLIRLVADCTLVFREVEANGLVNHFRN